MDTKLNILSIGSTVPSMGQDISQSSAYGRLIIGSLFALQMRGHKVLYLQLGNPRGREEVGSIECIYNGLKLRIGILRLNIKISNPNISALIWFLSPEKREYIVNKLTEYLEDKPDIVISENNQHWYFGKIIAEKFKIFHVLRIHSIRGLYARQLCKSLWHSGYQKRLIVLSECPLSLTYTMILAKLSDYNITLTYVEENALRKALIHNVHTIEGTYVYLPEEINVQPFKYPNSDNFIFVTKDATIRPLFMKWFTRKINVPILVREDNYMNKKKWCSIIKGATIIVRPQLYLSGLPMGLIEALAYGKVVLTTSIVASKIKGLKNWKHLIIEDDFTRYPSIVNHVLGNPELKNYIETNARTFYKKFLSPRHHGKRLEEVLNYVIEKHR